MYGNTLEIIMEKAKRRKNVFIKLPTLDKKDMQQKVRPTIYKYPKIPFLFYGDELLILIGELLFVFKSLNIV